MPPSAKRPQRPEAHGSNVAPAPATTAPARGSLAKLNQRVGLAMSVVIPLLELGAIGFVTWVVSDLICERYLIQPSQDMQQTYNIQPRRSTGLSLLVVYALLLLLLLIPWFRLLQVIWMGHDLVPLGDRSRDKTEMSTKKFDRYDAYICDYQGMPLWCDKCHNWKPDRAHHCKELNRCVRKMDHFCPWAGGIIAESTHKFFMQFIFFAALYTLYSMLVLAVFLGEHDKKMHSRPGTWVGAIAVCALFFLFSFSMTGMTGWNLMINFTSVEGLQRGGIHNIAFLISRTPKDSVSPPSTGTLSKKERYTSDSEETWPVLCTIQRSARRSYVVMQTKPMEHPWYTTLMMGWKDTMGEKFIDWILPFKQSPCKRKNRRGEFEWGESIFDMARKYEADNPGIHLSLLEGLR